MNQYQRLRAKDLFPELADKSNPNRYIDFMAVNDFKTFCKRCMKKANIEPNEDNNLVAEYALDLLIRKDLLDPNKHQTYVDTLIVAAMLYNAYYKQGDDYHNLFKARVEFDEIANQEDYEYGPLPEQFREMIWDTIEGQLGDCTPMAKTKPSPNTPQDLFATAIFMANTFKTDKDNL